MMLRILTLIACCLAFNAKAQKTYYITQNEQKVSLKEFNVLVDKSKDGWAYLKTDTATFVKLAPTYTQGQLSKFFLDEIRSTLQEDVKEKIDTNAILMITYATGIEHNLRPGFRLQKKVDHHQLDYVKYLKTLGNIAYFNVYDSNLHPDSIYTCLYRNLRDKKKIFTKFFDFQYPLFSNIIIRTDGKYFVANGVTVNTIDINKVIKEMVKKDFIGFK
jgi:hypothetical protein